MTRRALLALLAGTALDPERLLWRPGHKLISIPAVEPVGIYIRFVIKRDKFGRCIGTRIERLDGPPGGSFPWDWVIVPA